MTARSGRVGPVRIFLVALLVALAAGAAFAEDEAPDRDPPFVLLFEPEPTSDGAAVVVRARVHDPSGVDSVTFWMKEPFETEYRPVTMARARDGSYLTWFPATDANRRVSYYVEAWDRLGNGPGHAGTAIEPHRMRVREALRGDRIPPATIAAAALLVILVNVFLLRMILRRDRLDRERAVWSEVLGAVLYKRGHDLMRAADRIVAWTARRMPLGRAWARVEILQWVRQLRVERLQHRGESPYADVRRAVKREGRTGGRVLQIAGRQVVRAHDEQPRPSEPARVVRFQSQAETRVAGRAPRG